MNTSPADLRTFRLSRNLSQPEVAELLNTPVGTWKNWEQGRTVPPGCLSLALDHVEWESGSSNSDWPRLD